MVVIAKTALVGILISPGFFNNYLKIITSSIKQLYSNLRVSEPDTHDDLNIPPWISTIITVTSAFRRFLCLNEFLNGFLRSLLLLRIAFPFIDDISAQMMIQFEGERGESIEAKNYIAWAKGTASWFAWYAGVIVSCFLVIRVLAAIQMLRNKIHIFGCSWLWHTIEIESISNPFQPELIALLKKTIAKVVENFKQSADKRAKLSLKELKKLYHYSKEWPWIEGAKVYYSNGREGTIINRKEGKVEVAYKTKNGRNTKWVNIHEINPLVRNIRSHCLRSDRKL